MNEQYEELARNCKVIYDDDNFAYLKADDIQEFFECGKWFERLSDIEQELFTRICGRFLDGTPKEYSSALDVVLDVEQKTCTFS